MQHNKNIPNGHNLPSVDITPCLSIKRSHGLGNVICLLPVLDRLHEEGYRINVFTRPEWIHAFSVLRSPYCWSAADCQADCRGDAIDLDEMTCGLVPTEHRTDEFAHLLGLGCPFSSARLNIPEVWTKPFERFRDGIVFAPEGGHPSRCWPTEQAARLLDHINGDKLILVGTHSEPEIPCHFDLRGQLELHELFGLLAVAGVVVTMDSAVLHIAAALGVPTVAIFGGVNPGFRVRQDQHVVAITAKMDCCPCNKDESCSGGYPCIHAVQPENVAETIKLARNINSRVIRQVPLTPNRSMLAG